MLLTNQNAEIVACILLKMLFSEVYDVLINCVMYSGLVVNIIHYGLIL